MLWPDLRHKQKCGQEKRRRSHCLGPAQTVADVKLRLLGCQLDYVMQLFVMNSVSVFGRSRAEDAVELHTNFETMQLMSIAHGSAGGCGLCGRLFQLKYKPDRSCMNDVDAQR